MTENTLLGVEDVAKIMKKHPRTIKRWLQDKGNPVGQSFNKIGGKQYTTEKKLFEAIEQPLVQG